MAFRIALPKAKLLSELSSFMCFPAAAFTEFHRWSSRHDAGSGELVKHSSLQSWGEAHGLDVTLAAVTPPRWGGAGRNEGFHDSAGAQSVEGSQRIRSGEFSPQMPVLSPPAQVGVSSR
jgi:hypothetical protein